MEATKILLSAEELSLVQDTHWLLTKNNIIEKAKLLFGELGNKLQHELGAYEGFPEAARMFSPKVFKGEYYQGLPYVMLDYPRLFARHDVFAMRTMFWWGNFFSITLQLKGSYQKTYGPLLLKHKETLANEGFFVSISNDEWRHDFEKENYAPILINENLLEKTINSPFLKIATKIPLYEWNNAGEVIRKYQWLLLEMVAK